MESQTQQFNDGIVNVYKVKNIAQKGNTPKKELTLKVGSLRYEERTVGMSRFFIAMQSQVKVSQMLRVPRINSVSAQDVVIPNDGMQYEIIQVQYPRNVEPPSMDLSLERLVATYDIT